MKRNRLHKLFAVRTPARRIVLHAVCFVTAFSVAYLLAAFLPYTVTVRADAYAAAHPYDSYFGAGSDEHALLMPTDEESYFTRLVLLERAERTVDVSTYKVTPDDGMLYFFAGLLKAADRGVKVRYVADAKFEGLDDYKALRTLLRSHENIEYYLYNPINVFDPAMLTVDMHDKLFTVDDATLIVGGANVGFSAYVYNHDLEVLVTRGERESAAVAQVKTYYNELLTCRHTRRKTEKPAAKLGDYKKYLLDRYEAYYASKPFDKQRDYRAEGLPVDKITLAHNPIEGKKRAPQILETMFTLAEHSRDVIFQTPYFCLTDPYLERFVRAAESADSFVLSTNSLYNSPNLAYGVYMKNRKKLLSPKLTLSEYQGRLQIHGKAAVFDDRLTVVGSFNMDERSAHIDTESVLVIDSRAFNAAMRDLLDDYRAQSLTVGLDNAYEPGGFAPPEVPADKRRLFAFYGRFFGLAIQLI